ncbi:DUF456 domain-containing protein [Bacillus xiapuensis]|uniref:DUF456 domain-containing protein n=1 Tax=Bacillus xiapuensis TaxID=2014075 RepID=UPI000C2441CC|nr:DUF456 domain-containing protein [Bacillus xiapuensis]
MSIVVWTAIVLLFVLSFLGLIFPVIPGIFVLWGGFILYYFGISREELSVIFWAGMVLLTIFIVLSDLLANSYFVKKYGGSKWGERVATLAVIVGSFITPPFGILYVPFFAVLMTEWFIQKDAKQAFKVGFATFVGFLSGTLAKFLIQAIMIIWFILEAIF